MVPAMRHRVAIKESEGVKRYRRSRETLLNTLKMLTNFVWNGGNPSRGDHFWTIPCDREKDFDCILSDAISELEDRRTAMKAAGLLLPEWGDLQGDQGAVCEPSIMDPAVRAAELAQHRATAEFEFPKDEVGG